MKTIPAILTSIILMLAVQVQAEPREFTSTNGQSMKAELVSHKAGKITLKRSDGQEFTVAPNVFSPEDQIFIKTWMEETPELVKYNFRIDADRKKLDSNFTDLDYKRVKVSNQAYEVKISNLSRDTASDLIIKYRVFFSNYADGEFSASSSEMTNFDKVEGEVKLDQELAYNQTLEFTTKSVKLETVDYDYLNDDRYKDELKGCMLRIVDASGNVVADWVAPVSWLNDKTWDSTTKGGQTENEVIIR